HNGVEVRNALANISVINNVAKVNSFQFVENIASKANSNTPSVSAEEAVAKSLEYLNIKTFSGLKSKTVTDKEIVFNKIDITASDVVVKLVYELTQEGDVQLAWNVNLDLQSRNHWWNIRIDAATGEYLSKNDWVTSCSWGESEAEHASHISKKEKFNVDFFTLDSQKNQAATTSIMAPSYRVIPYYTESPNHGPFELLVDPADPLASPNGWHDDGTSYTTTRGNNVRSIWDQNGFNSGPETSQSAAGLIFDYPYLGPYEY
ncbi:MAG: M36 family metallopeptidase, partial [Flavobacteriaceae bacterium]